jgi:hypothetical protein
MACVRVQSRPPTCCTATAARRPSPLSALLRSSAENVQHRKGFHDGYGGGVNNWAEATPSAYGLYHGRDRTPRAASAQSCRACPRDTPLLCNYSITVHQAGKEQIRTRDIPRCSHYASACSVLGVRWRRRVCWHWVVCSVADLVRGTTLTQELPTCASWHAICSTEDLTLVIPAFEHGGSLPVGRMTFRGRTWELGGNAQRPNGTVILLRQKLDDCAFISGARLLWVSSLEDFLVPAAF